jgi:alcohol dehydrogenase class IV
MLFEFATAARIVFGPGAVSRVPEIARESGAHRALVITGTSAGRSTALIEALRSAKIDCVPFTVSGEPTIDCVRQGAVAAQGCDNVISIGGGSVIDGGKAIAALATNPGDVLDYLEVIGQAAPLKTAPLPFIAIPTTSGTGSEVTRNAVLGSPEHRVKASLRSSTMLAKAAIVDPDLTRNLPPDLTATTGLDALTQLIEPYVSARANAVADVFCLDGLRRARTYLSRAFANGYDAEAREGMALVSLYGGLALANAGLGVIHGFAAPLGGMFDAPHGAVVAAILPYGVEANIRALRDRSPEHPALVRYREIARILTGDANAIVEDAVDWIRQLCAKLSIRPLRTFGVDRQHVDTLVVKAAHASSTKANPLVLNERELAGVLEQAI